MITEGDVYFDPGGLASVTDFTGRLVIVRRVSTFMGAPQYLLEVAHDYWTYTTAVPDYWVRIGTLG